MKICKFRKENKQYWGAIRDEQITVLDAPLEKLPENIELTSQVFSVFNIKFLVPFSPSKIVCVGRNYSDHAKELGNDVPTEPLLFLKAPSALILDGDDIVLPNQSKQVEYEGELALIIGRDCKNLAESATVADYIFGYLPLNDVTARDLQKKDVQFTRAKSFDTFCPISPIIETEFDPADAQIQTTVNGIVKQSGRTSQMIFNVDFLVKYISNQMTLRAGDIIATGTPAGVSKLSAGDTCEVEIEGLTRLSNQISQFIK